MDRDPFDLVGDVLDGQFRVDAFAGEGDLSVVYRGHHLGVDADVAIKCLNLPETLDPALARPLVEGFREASRVHYRLARGNLHIAQTIASGSTLVPRSGVVVPYMVREWYEGESLRSDLARRRAEKQSGRSIDEVLTLFETAFDGVAHAHAQGEMHLAIDPSNLFVVDGAGSKPPALKVLDFGVASTMRAFATGIPAKARPTAGLHLLFPAYAAPEQLDRAVGPLGPWTDVYTLALVMMEVLSDRVVMGETETGAIVEHALDEQRRPTPQAHGLKLPSYLDRALTRAVARAPERRQKSAAELWKDVRNAVRTMAPRSMSLPPTISTPPPEPSPSCPPLPLLTPARGRVRAPTLVGLNPQAAGNAAPAGAVGHRGLVASAASVATRPMAFEPKGAPSVPVPPLRASGRPVKTSQGVLGDMELAVIDGHLLAVGSTPPTIGALQEPEHASSGDPPPPAPSASGSIEPWPLIRRKPPSRFASLVSGRATSIVLPLAGALFWGTVFVVFVRLLASSRDRAHHGAAVAAPPTIAATTASSSLAPLASPASFATAAHSAHVHPAAEVPSAVAEAASGAGVASAAAGGAPAAVAAAPATATPSATGVTADDHFRRTTAVRSLDGKWRDVAKCRRGKAWGKASTTVTFSGDGTVAHVDVGPPFAGTPTGDCIADTLSGARVDAFGENTAIVLYKVYVAPR